MTEIQTQKKAPLEDLMVAMDVVDTLRHQQGLVERELDGEARRSRLLERLRDLYDAQGIEVSDQVLREGIVALEEERFKYKPVQRSWATRLAGVWVSRSRWGKPFSFLAVLGSLFYGYYFVSDVMPENAMREALPTQLQSALKSVQSIAKNPQIIEQAQHQAKIGEQALATEDYATAQQVLDDLSRVSKSLQQSYSIRVISRENENSGIWRVPDSNQSSRNYYLIVEAIDANNRVVELPILNEESNQRVMKKTWGIRVNQKTFYKIAEDKKDDGIIQANKVGEKQIGYLKPIFTIATTGATITDW